MFNKIIADLKSRWLRFKIEKLRLGNWGRQKEKKPGWTTVFKKVRRTETPGTLMRPVKIFGKAKISAKVYRMSDGKWYDYGVIAEGLPAEWDSNIADKNLEAK